MYLYGNVPCCALCFAWDAWGSGLLLGAAAMDEAAFKAWLGVEVETTSGYRYALSTAKLTRGDLGR